SDQDFAAAGPRYWRATGWPCTVLAAASTKPRTTSSGVAPATGGSGSMPTSLVGRDGAWVTCTVGELLGTVEQAVSSSPATRAASSGGQRLTGVLRCGARSWAAG